MELSADRDSPSREFGSRVAGTAGAVREPPALLQPPFVELPGAEFAGAETAVPPARERTTDRSGGRTTDCCAFALAAAATHIPAMSQPFTTIQVRVLCRATVSSFVQSRKCGRDRATPRSSPPISQPSWRLVAAKETRLKIDFAPADRGRDCVAMNRERRADWGIFCRGLPAAKDRLSPTFATNCLRNGINRTDNDEDPWCRSCPPVSQDGRFRALDFP